MSLEIGSSGSLSKMRKYLQRDCRMLQIWAGKIQDDTDYILFVSERGEEFAVLTSPGGDSTYTVSAGGDIIFLHEKNLHKLADM